MYVIGIQTEQNISKKFIKNATIAIQLKARNVDLCSSAILIFLKKKFLFLSSITSHQAFFFLKASFKLTSQKIIAIVQIIV